MSKHYDSQEGVSILTESLTDSVSFLSSDRAAPEQHVLGDVLDNISVGEGTSAEYVSVLVGFTVKIDQQELELSLGLLQY